MSVTDMLLAIKFVSPDIRLIKPSINVTSSLQFTNTCLFYMLEIIDKKKMQFKIRTDKAFNRTHIFIIIRIIDDF